MILVSKESTNQKMQENKLALEFNFTEEPIWNCFKMF